MSIFMETTKISAEKTVGQLQGVLAKYGATQVLTEYAAGQVEAVSFKMMAGGAAVPFRLPCRWRALMAVMNKKRGMSASATFLEDRARRVAWRQILRWVEAQCALISTGMVAAEEVFLPYMQSVTGLTLFERFQVSGAAMLGYEERK